MTAAPPPVARFHSEVRCCAQAALERASACPRTFLIAGRSVRLLFSGPDLAAALAPALDHLAADVTSPPDLTVLLFDTAGTGVAPPPPPWNSLAFGPRGVIDGYNTGPYRTVYQPGADVLLLYDTEACCGVYWTRDSRRLPYWESSFPLRTLFHWWLEKQPLQPAHAAAVGLPEGGVLIAGPGGSGKSTSALACLDSELFYAGDDYVLIGVSPPAVHSLYNTAKLDPHALAWFPRLEAARVPRQPSEKALLFLQQCAPGRLCAGFPIRAILAPHVTGCRDTRLLPGTPAEAFRALAPTTVFQLPGAGKPALEKLAALVRRTPAYRLEVGTDLAQIPRCILELIRRGGQA